jgi:hypothetical protein
MGEIRRPAFDFDDTSRLCVVSWPWDASSVMTNQAAGYKGAVPEDQPK